MTDEEKFYSWHTMLRFPS